jgi:hypothetical protein
MEENSGTWSFGGRGSLTTCGSSSTLPGAAKVVPYPLDLAEGLSFGVATDYGVFDNWADRFFVTGLHSLQHAQARADELNGA